MKQSTDPMAQKMSGKAGHDNTEPMNQQMSKASSNVLEDHGIDPPKRGDHFECKVCGMALEVTADCKCEEEGMVHFHCCGQELVKV